MMSDVLFDPGPAEPIEQLSVDRRRTIRYRQLLAQGVHPITGARLAGNGETCGTCGHLDRYRYRTKSLCKCDLNDTRSAATDVRVFWPACAMWAALGGDR